MAHADGLSVASKSSVDPCDQSTNGKVGKAGQKKQDDRRLDEVVDPGVGGGALKCKDKILVLQQVSSTTSFRHNEVLL